MMGGSYRIGHYQCGCAPGDFERNLATVCAGLQQAAERGVQVLSFPEAFLAGYWRSEARCRENAWPIDGPEIRLLLDRTRAWPVTFMVGFNELRGDDLYDTAIVVERGERVGWYSKAWPVMPYFTPSRETPVFQRDGLCFGVLICADGGYPEPARILAMKGARVLFAPHYNHLGVDTVVDHYQVVRHDHIARAVENGVFFVRGNNVAHGYQDSLESAGVGYGDSYILDPNGMAMAAAGLHGEGLITADIDVDRRYYAHRDRARRSAEAYWEQLRDMTVARAVGAT